jgi:3-methyladenine DNA glycosylase AlkD
MDGFDPAGAAVAVAEALRAVGTAERAAQEKRYLKSELEFFGVTVPALRRVVTGAVRGYPGLDEAGTVAWAVALWREPVHERRMAAVELLTLAAPRLGAGDLAVVQQLLRESGTWALVDGLAVNVAGAIALRDPRSWPVIDRWAADEDFWLRRSALLALLRGIRAGQPDLARFTGYAEAMLAEREFFIRKAIGWVLREISKRDPVWVASWTEQHQARMSGVTFREAVRRLPAADAERLRALRLFRATGQGRRWLARCTLLAVISRLGIALRV